MVPKIIHFIYLYGEHTKSFSIHHYLSVKSNYLLNNDCKILIHTNMVDRLKDGSDAGRQVVKELSDRVSILPIPLEFYPTSGKLKNTPYMAHLSDYIRLKILYEYGGVYLDLDSIATLPFRSQLDFNSIDKLVACWEYPGPDSKSICNGVMIIPEKSDMLLEWITDMTNNYDPLVCIPNTPEWTIHSVQYLYNLWQKYPGKFLLLDYDKFEPFYLTYDDTVGLFFIDKSDIVKNSKSMQVHLWETRNEHILKLLNLEYFNNCNSTYAKIVSGMLTKVMR